MREIKSASNTQIHSNDFETFLTELTMAFWNRLGAQTTSGPLAPRDFISFYEALEQSLHPYRKVEQKALTAPPSEQAH